jgi:EmrB/QacA subfamily drug resistance transporter
MTDTGRPTPPGLSRGQLRLLIGALVTGMLLAALDQMIVSTAMPTIVRSFHGIDHYSWVITAYLLASTASTPLYGKLSDLYGRRPVVFFALGAFMLGSLLAGAARNMTWLIASRGVQGLGAGGLGTMAYIVLADVVEARERARYQGLFGLAYGLASVAGPLVGGYFAEHNWRWIFLVNLPVAVVVLLVSFRVLRLLPHRPREHRIDWWGALLLVLAVCSVLLALSWGGREYPWRSAPVLGLFAAGAVLAVVFLAVQAGVAEPIVPLALFRRATFSLAIAACFVFGFCLFGTVVFMQLYFQVARAASPMRSGLLMVPLMAGLLVASIGSGRLINRVGRYKWSPVAGACATTAGVWLLSRLSEDTAMWRASTAVLVLGLGLGLALQPLVLAAQTTLDPRAAGAGTSTATFFRSLGGAAGVATLGAVLTNRLAAGLPGSGTGGSIDQLTATDVPPGPLRTAVRHSFTVALHPVFVTAAAVSVLAVLITVALPNSRLPASAIRAAPASPGHRAGGTGRHRMAGANGARSGRHRRRPALAPPVPTAAGRR